jgi:hypothetical protein
MPFPGTQQLHFPRKQYNCIAVGFHPASGPAWFFVYFLALKAMLMVYYVLVNTHAIGLTGRCLNKLAGWNEMAEE